LWKTTFPSVKPYYAVKCNPDKTLIRWLAEGGAGFDCASANEVRIVESAVSAEGGSDIVFANPCKSADDIKSLKHMTVIDSAEEIDKLKTHAYKGQSLVRIRVEDGGSLMRFSAKFGLEPRDIPDLAAHARKAGQKLGGISFHVGSGCKDPDQYRLAIEQAKTGIELLKAAGHDATTIDIGGGFMNGPLFNQTATIINPLLHNLPKDLRVIAEPGRFFAASSQDLFVRVIGKKSAGRDQKGWRYTLDESLYGQFSCIPFDYAKPQWIRVRSPGEKKRKLSPAILYGRTCDSLDFIAAAEEAEELEEGDWLWFPHMGAYTTATSTEFNGFPKPPCIVLEESMPEPEDFSSDSWPSGLKYVEPVKVPV
jgi:ornithine decarboxylase